MSAEPSIVSGSRKPCRHPVAEQVRNCRVCHKWHHDGLEGAGFRALFEVSSPVPGQSGHLACIHRGPETGGVVECGSCRGRVRLKLFACSVHGDCVLERSVDGHACCATCRERQSAGRELLPGIIDPLPDPEQTRRPDGWAIDPQVRDRHVDALAKLLATPFPAPKTLQGDGVVICGGGKYWPGIVVAVRMLRDVSQLPVQIWYRGKLEAIDPADLLDVPGVTYRDSTAVLPGPRICRGWESKGIALTHCGFRRALLMDADAYCVSDPQPLLDLTEEHCFVFWNDLPDTKNHVNMHWYGMTLAQRQHIPQVQGGQLAIHIEKFWRELVIFHWGNQHSDYCYHNPKFVRRAGKAADEETMRQWHGYGDQDVWVWVLAATKGNWKSLGPAKWQHPAFVCALGGQDLIIHRCQGKLLWDGKDVRSKHLPGDALVSKYLDRQLVRGSDASQVFSNIYKRGVWGEVNLSGRGSDATESKPYLAVANAFIRTVAAQSVVDLGCGDGFICSQLDASEIHVVDVHRPHVKMLEKRFPRRAHCMDLDRDRADLPSGDLALLKDVMHHWPSALVVDWLAWARRCGKWKRVLVTNDCRQEFDGQDCLLGMYRGLDPAMSPLKGCGLVEITRYLHKAVMLLVCDPK